MTPPEGQVTEAALERIAAAYRRFAIDEAHGRSPLYEAFALGVADTVPLLRLLCDLPPPKRQPNLLLGAVRHVAGVAPDWPCFRHTAVTRWDEVRAVMLSHATQTNEPGRCAVLLPVLARLPQPLALIEVGASAGLCLLPDRYAYRYGDGTAYLSLRRGAGTGRTTGRAVHVGGERNAGSMDRSAWRGD